MENEEERLGKDDRDETEWKKTIIHENDSNKSQQESRYADDDSPITISNDSTEADEYEDDIFEDDEYYDVLGPYTRNSDGAANYFEDAHFASESSSVPRIDKVGIAEIGGGDDDERLEENNNDPNNNMDSIEMEDGRGGRQADAIADPMKKSINEIKRDPSPRPGCSKDYSYPITSKMNKTRIDNVDERAKQFLSLISKINHDSILAGLRKNPNIGINDLRLWDVLPEKERIDDTRDIQCCSSTVTGTMSMGNSMKNVKSLNKRPIGRNGDNNTIVINKNPEATTASIKRGPAEDICTIGCKKASSKPDSSTILAASRLSMSKVVSTSKIPAEPSNVRIRRQAVTVGKSIVENGKGELVVTSVSSHRPNVKFPPAPVAIQTQSKIATKQQIPHELVVPLKTAVTHNHNNNNNNRGAFETVRNGDLSKHAKIMPNNTLRVRNDLKAASRCNVSTTVRVSNAFPTGQMEAIPPWKDPPRITRRDENLQNVPLMKKKNVVLPAQRSDNEEREKQQEAEKKPASSQSNNDAPPLVLEARGPNRQQEKSQNTERPVCMEMYYRLIDVFPNVDRDYIKKLCPPEWGPGDREAQLEPLVGHLLERAEKLPMIKVNNDNGDDNGGKGENCTSVDDIYENLLGIFPDADPHYLREFAEKNVLKPNAVKEFVESKLEKRDYPTRDQYMAMLKITEQQRQYTIGFDVKHFLTIIPDPFSHFLDRKRKCGHNTVAFEFLKTYFNKIRVNTISRAYSLASHNLSQTAVDLERVPPELKYKRCGIEMPTSDILLLQEIAFIKHKDEINYYIEKAKRQEEAEFKMLKEQNSLIECQCCYDAECLPSKCSSCENGHLFCNNCVITGTSSKMGEGETRISCFLNCGSEFSLSTLQQVLIPTTFSILLKKRQAAEVMEADLEGLVSCPFCHFASIPPEEDKVFKCLNPECTKESCRLCKEISHVPLKCDEVMKADKARRYIEEKMTEALARKCYKCKRAFFKEEGCNKITCPCGASMCYLCDQPIKDYTHFRGQGSDAKNLCPLYSDTIRLDAVAVRTVAEQAQKEVMKLNPNVKVDTTKLLPAIPSRSAGPHTTVLNADELPRRAQRVLDLQPEHL